jgi:poly-gamma-glutamate capsule biosynthesis protein CapA/YwtB (metallophosphatase superfamily)
VGHNYTEEEGWATRGSTKSGVIRQRLTPIGTTKGRWIGSADDIEEARKLKGNATIAGWGTVLVLEGDSIVE